MVSVGILMVLVYGNLAPILWSLISTTVFVRVAVVITLEEEVAQGHDSLN